MSWPLGLGSKGNEGVAGLIRQTFGAVGYVELIYAEQNNIPFGSVQNSAGMFVKASTETVSAASAEIPADFSGTTWLLIPIQSQDPSRKKVVVDFANWILADGQELAPTLSYAKIPANISARAKQALQQVQ